MPDGGTLVPIIYASDVTFSKNLSEEKKPCPINLPIWNILSSRRNKESKHATVLMVLSPISPEIVGIVVRDARRRHVNNEILCKLIEVIIVPMAALGNSGLEVACTDIKV